MKTFVLFSTTIHGNSVTRTFGKPHVFQESTIMRIPFALSIIVFLLASIAPPGRR